MNSLPALPRPSLHLPSARTAVGGAAAALRGAAVRFWFSALMAGHGIVANPLRSALTILGVVIGVASVVSLMGIGEGARRAVVEQLRSLGANVVIIEAVDPSVEFPPEKAAELVERVPSLEAATPVVSTEAVMRWRRARGTAEVLGVNEAFPLIRDHPVIAGQFFSSLHVAQRSPVAVLGYEYGVALLGGRSPVGQSISLDGRSFRIIGVLAPKGEGRGEGIDGKVLIPYTVAQQIAEKRTVDQIWAKAASADAADLALAQLGRIFRRELGLDPGAPSLGGGPAAGGAEPLPGGGPVEGPMPIEGRPIPFGADGPRRARAAAAIQGAAGGGAPAERVPESPALPLGRGEDRITITNLNQMVKEADRANRVMTLLLGGIAAVSLLVGGLGIMNIMLVSVSERTAEIGLRRALGAKQGDLLVQFLLEALYLSGIGAVIGVGVGVWGTHLFAGYGFETVVSAQAIRIATGVALAAGLLFGVYPAVNAASLPPVEALRRQ